MCALWFLCRLFGWSCEISCFFTSALFCFLWLSNCGCRFDGVLRYLFESSTLSLSLLCMFKFRRASSHVGCFLLLAPVFFFYSLPTNEGAGRPGPRSLGLQAHATIKDQVGPADLEDWNNPAAQEIKMILNASRPASTSGPKDSRVGGRRNSR